MANTELPLREPGNVGSIAHGQPVSGPGHERSGEVRLQNQYSEPLFDGDGQFEDLNGNRMLDLGVIIAPFDPLFDSTVTDQVSAYAKFYHAFRLRGGQ